MRHGDVGNPLLHLCVRCHADQQLELAVGGRKPEVGDQDREDDSAHRVKPPFKLAAADGGEQTKAVDEKIVAVVFPEDADLRVDVAEGPAVAEQREFCESGNCNRYHRREM